MVRVSVLFAIELEVVQPRGFSCLLGGLQLFAHVGVVAWQLRQKRPKTYQLASSLLSQTMCTLVTCVVKPDGDEPRFERLVLGAC